MEEWNWSVIFSGLAVIISIIAIFQASNQSKINNKQFLFNKRIRAFYLLQELQECFYIYLEKSKEINSSDNKKIISSKIDLLVDNSFFDDLGDNRTERLKKKTKDLMILSLEIKFYFPEVAAKSASDFFSNYAMYLATLNSRYERIDSTNNTDPFLVEAALKNIEKKWADLESDDTLLTLEKSIKFKN